MELRDLVRRGLVLLRRGAVHDVRVLQPAQRLVGGNHYHFELVDLVEFGGLGLRRARHARQLFVHAEVVLEGNGGQRLILALHLHAFLGFDRLVQPVGPAAAGHQAPGELVHDDDFAILDYVFHVALVERVRFDGGLDVVLEIPVLRVGDVLDAKQLLDFLPAFVGDSDGLVLLVHHVIAGEGGGLARRALDLLAALQPWDDAVHAVILVGGLLACAGDDERRARFVNQDGVHLVYDGEVVPALHAIAQVELHVVAQVVEPKLVVCSVGNIT